LTLHTFTNEKAILKERRRCRRLGEVLDAGKGQAKEIRLEKGGVVRMELK